jgi:hypothetical protein
LHQQSQEKENDRSETTNALRHEAIVRTAHGSSSMSCVW